MIWCRAEGKIQLLPTKLDGFTLFIFLKVVDFLIRQLILLMKQVPSQGFILTTS